MSFKLTQIAILSNRQIEWIDHIDSELYEIDVIQLVDETLSFLNEKMYDLLLIDDNNPFIELEEIIPLISRNYPLISIIIVTEAVNPDYILNLVETGADDVFNMKEDIAYLVRRLNLAIQRNQNRQTAIQQSRHLNSVTIVSRRLHNATDPNTLIEDALRVIQFTFDLMGLAIVLEVGNQYHLRAHRGSTKQEQPTYDVMTNLHPYDPIRVSIEKGMVLVFQDLSENPHLVQLPIFDALQSAIIVPLRYVNITLGALVAFGHASNPLTRDDIVIYEHLSTHLGSAYQNVRHSYSQHASTRANRQLLRTWQRLAGVYSSDEISSIIQQLASGVTGVKQALVWLYEESHEHLIIKATNPATIQIFEHLYTSKIIENYINQFDTQLRPLVFWLSGRNTHDIGELFQVMGGQQLVMVPIKDEARLLGCLLVSSNSNEEMSPESISLLEGMAYAAGQTLERNMFMQYQNQQTERLEAITRSIHDGIFLVDELQNVVFCNPQLTELTGISQSRIINQSVDTLFVNLAQHTNARDQIYQQLTEARQQLLDTTSHSDYPVIELYFPSIESRVYIEFIQLTDVNDKKQKTWIGVIRDTHNLSMTEQASPATMVGTILSYIQETAREIYQTIIPLDKVDDTHTRKVAKQLRQHSLEIEQLLIIADNITQFDKLDRLKYTSNDPNKLLSVILNKPPLLQFDEQLDVRTSLKNINIQVNRQYIMQVFTNLIEVGLSFSGKKSLLVQMGAQSKRLIFRVVTSDRTIPMDHIHQALSHPDQTNHDIPYSVQLRLYFIQQVVQKHDGELVIKKSVKDGMQFNIFLPTQDATRQQGIPERRFTNLMIYDSQQVQSDVNYQILTENDFEVLFVDQLEQLYDEVELFRIDAIILSIRQNHNAIINFVQRLRNEKQVTLPIIVLSTLNTEDNRIDALRSGVDVFIGLPISNQEFMAHLENIFERAKLPERVHEPVEIGQLKVDFAQRQVLLEGKSVNLTRIEYELLAMLALNFGKTVTHTQLLTEVWGPEYKDDKNYLWVNMSRLRRKLAKNKHKTRYIVTQPGIGYILRAN